MARVVQTRWDARYTAGDRQMRNGDASPFLIAFAPQVNGKHALDVACGTGRNAIFLAKRGFHVDALDISPVGLAKLEQAAAGLDITTHAVDLDEYQPPVNTYDLIIAANYLNRPLIPKLLAALNPHGILVMDTFMNDPRNSANQHNPDYLLRQNEFLSYISDGFETLKYQEFSVIAKGGTMWKQAIAVRKIETSK